MSGQTYHVYGTESNAGNLTTFGSSFEPSNPTPGKTVYFFLDEGGNMDFSPGGTQYFTISSVMATRPFPIDEKLSNLKFTLMENGHDIEYFHATEDAQIVRTQVFDAITAHLGTFRVDSVVVEKRKAAPKFREHERFYPELLGYLLQYVLNSNDYKAGNYSRVMVITDALPNKKNRKSIEKGVKMALSKMLPPEIYYRVVHHDSKSCYGLQVADYCNWAIYRAWDSGDRRSLSRISSAVKSQFAIFARGRINWY